MTTFNEREAAFEREFVHDEELRFKARARRDHLLGLWAAEKLGLSGPAAESYARELVISDVEAHDPLDKIRKDFAAQGVMLADDQIRRSMSELMARAVTEIKAGR